MKTTFPTTLGTLSLLALAATSCGDNLTKPDAPLMIDAAPDAFAFPAAPTLGAAIDRMGRPAVNTALNALLEPSATTKAAKKDAYNHLTDPNGWSLGMLSSPAGRTVRDEFAIHAGLFDSLDTGAVMPQATGGNATGRCGNLVPGYSINPTNTSTATSNYPLVAVLADDQLYLDTQKGTCGFYLSVEIEAVAGVLHTQCGGRTLTHDVIDTSYSLLTAGLQGFGPGFVPNVGDGVAAHTDVSSTTFPFLGAPH